MGMERHGGRRVTADEAIQKAALTFLPKQYGAVILALDQKGMTIEEVGEKIGTTAEYARRILCRLHKMKVTCVVSWRRTRATGVHTKIWGLGDKDEKQPQKLTRRQISARYRQNQRGLTGEVRLGMFGL